MQPPSHVKRRSIGFTLVEVLVVVAILTILIALGYTAIMRGIQSGKIAVSSSNLQELATANLDYAADNDGNFCPAQDEYNLVRWHGVRTSASAPFDPSKGYLAPYLGAEGKVKIDPLFLDALEGPDSFEDGSGGYGYNENYIGGTPADYTVPINIHRVPNLSQTVMFTTTAFAKSDGLQEYPFSESPEWVNTDGSLGGPLQPSVHFRANGKALVAWCDGHVTAESPSQLGGTDYYGGNSAKDMIGWFGPLDNNGYWNPQYSP